MQSSETPFKTAPDVPILVVREMGDRVKHDIILSMGPRDLALSSSIAFNQYLDTERISAALDPVNKLSHFRLQSGDPSDYDRVFIFGEIPRASAKSFGDIYRFCQGKEIYVVDTFNAGSRLEELKELCTIASNGGMKQQTETTDEEQPTMEKITVEIGLKRRSGGGEIKDAGGQDDIRWLSNTLKISYKRAEKLVERMKQTARSIPLVLNHEQLARYVALRTIQAGKTGEYRWCWPKVTQYEEDECGFPSEPIELRPSRRFVPGC